MPAALRPMTPDDAPDVLDCMKRSFADLEERIGLPPTPPPASPLPGLVRIRHLIATDPGGAWVAHDRNRVVGAALALVREGVWGLSLLVVLPGEQSNGTGSALLRAALAHGNGSRGGIILASEDVRALRAYARSGFDLRPAMDARGVPTALPPEPPGVRPLRWPDDRELVEAVGRAVRTASHVPDVPAWLESGSELLVHGGGGFAVRSGANIRAVAATEDAIAADLLRACIARVPNGEEVGLDFITGGQDWAVRVLLDAGLRLRPGGAIFTRGEVGPMRPYVPSGSYL